MRLAGLAGKNPRVSSANLDIERWLGDHHPDLVEISAGEKGGETAEPGSVAERCHSGRYARHVLFRDPHFEEPVGKAFCENIRPRGVRQVAIEDDRISAGGGKLAERLPPDLSQRSEFPGLGRKIGRDERHTHTPARARFESSTIASSSSCWVGTLACQL